MLASLALKGEVVNFSVKAKKLTTPPSFERAKRA
jgi:hypothetical protein